jgi:hypothetical protein
MPVNEKILFRSFQYLFSLKTIIYAILLSAMLRENHAVLGGKNIDFRGIIKFLSHLNQSLSKLKSTKFPPPLCTPSQAVSSSSVASFRSELKPAGRVSFYSYWQEEQTEKKTEDYGEKAQIYFTGKISCYFIFGKFFL